ncbi:hypothetical protein K1719_037548 [Acacia pycnantha]|nr:hypothetical protein K1719_037548 [Acacia pycnantha]
MTNADLEYEFLANKLYWGFGSLMALTKLQDPSNAYIVDDICMIEVEFVKDLGRIDKALVPLLEKVCSWNHSLMDCKNKRSRKFMGWVFNSLGQVLPILKNTKWKDMKNEESREELQHLWEELEMSGLDLSWLDVIYVKLL